MVAGTREDAAGRNRDNRQTVTIDSDAPIGPALQEKLTRMGATVEGTVARVLAGDPPRQIRELLEAFHAENTPIKDLTLKRASLEEVFLILTGRELRE